MALRSAKVNEDALQPVWGQGFSPTAGLPPGAELTSSVAPAIFCRR